ncbi:MAG TPA: translation elongation factor Ts [Actinomycetota bacterium]|jgi:elongation factor Ts
MPEITAEQVKRLREMTGAGMMDCKRALQETGGDVDAARRLLAERGMASVGKRAGRRANQGRIESYVHFNAKVGSLVEVNCETDFVANTDEFRQLAKDIALHIASPAEPQWLERADVPASEVDSVRHVFEVQAKELGKPDEVTGKIVAGKLESFFQDNVLLEQKYVKDDAKTIQQLLDEVGARTGEKVVIRRFVRFRLGDDGPEAAG